MSSDSGFPWQHCRSVKRFLCFAPIRLSGLKRANIPAILALPMRRTKTGKARWYFLKS